MDSHITRVIRDHISPRFDNRLFLSATPHNGHSNSFSALLEILDPQRFTRRVPLSGPEALRPVMVRRLKRDLEGMAGQRFPKRRVDQYTVTHREGRWRLSGTHLDPTDLGEAEPFELEMAELLEAYTEVMRGQLKRQAGKLTLITLQKRLLSSPAAFYQTLKKHRDKIEGREDEEAEPSTLPMSYGEAYGEDDALIEAEEDAKVAHESAQMTDSDRARALRDRLYDLATRYQRQPDARVKALLSWMRARQCPAIQLGGAQGAERGWSATRVIIFTEYQSTLCYLSDILTAAFNGTDAAEDRLITFKGGMGDEARREIQRRFTDPKDKIRVLLATDAAREGLNLQAQCADLFHFDIPWNPARLEQRNGRIDRAMQPEEEVRCAYFTYPQRPADLTLDALMRKLDTIKRELGSLGEVLLDRIEAATREGISADTVARLEVAGEVAPREHEAQRLLQGQQVKEEIDQARKTLERSRKLIQFEPAHLRRGLNVALKRMGLEPLRLMTRPPEGVDAAWTLPTMPADWRRTLDPLRPPKDKDESWWAWRQRCPPKPVIFEPPKALSQEVILLHLEHPLVKRLLAGFRAEGYRQNLSRISVVMTRKHAHPHALLIGRLTLFGPEARRLHDQLIYAAAPLMEATGLSEALSPTEALALRADLDVALAQPTPATPGLVARSKQLAPEAYRALWPIIQAEAEAAEHDARLRLDARGRLEAQQLKELLIAQRARLKEHTEQLELPLPEPLDAKNTRQLEDDKRYMRQRLKLLKGEIEEEPARLKALYAVSRARLTPVGLIWMWGA